ncbi:nuclear receptor-binding protein 2-like isoform X1 [Arapaima gigas]
MLLKSVVKLSYRLLCGDVSQGNVPGIESASLAMDTEEGVEVVWNEVLFSDRKVFKALEDKIKEMFENLMQVEHPNIVKFHKYWLDMRDSRARVVFITEYMSSGSLKQFLKKTKKNHKTMNVKAWKRWCTQILSALSYLHSCEPPIIHGNLTCDTIFIQHNGLLKIGSVWHRLFVNGKFSITHLPSGAASICPAQVVDGCTAGERVLTQIESESRQTHLSTIHRK